MITKEKQKHNRWKRYSIKIAICSMLFLINVILAGCSKGKSAEETQALRPTESIETETETIKESETEAPETETVQTETDLKEPQTTEVLAETEDVMTESFGETQMGESDIQSRELSEDEIDFFSEYIQRKENAGFLLSSYSVPEDIDLYQLFYNGIPDGNDNSITEEERNAYLENWTESWITDITPINRSRADEFLQKHMGIELSQITKTFGWDYLPEYDSYYIMHGDTNADIFVCTYGFMEGDMIYLECSNRIDNIFTTVVTLKKVEDDYWFVSNQRIKDTYDINNDN